MKLNTIARTAAAVLLSLGALLATSGGASAAESVQPPVFTPPYCAQP
ncbi:MULTISPECIES: hypothetical protein [Lentzea]|uniref:Uncharacterized protein n=1 Tax=Lentzea albida TaxID=65499 RepID=A0A1H9U7K5_9PSEU|nr:MULTISPECIES: hypothetical protein [Lentzea]USX48715.1 hypothetical protein ND450_24920 [Lentzea sp. HUAS12]SES05560.1 hypothetical protein SAMN04488000_11583 [Lentzea albida]